MEQLDNLGSDSGTFSSGFNATAFLQPGENEFSIGTVPSGAYNGDFTYHENDHCELTIFGAFPDGNKQELSNLTATIIDGKPNVKTSTIYPDNHKTPLVNVDGVISHRLT
ncbi:glycosyl hydrolase family 26, partial [Vibrio cholerae]